MRINLKTPFAEKDAAKALGARWDAAQKLWYITDVADLTPFMRWIPDLQAARAEIPMASLPASKPAGGVVTKPQTLLPRCACKVLPWVDCEHTLT